MVLWFWLVFICSSKRSKITRSRNRNAPCFYFWTTHERMLQNALLWIKLLSPWCRPSAWSGYGVPTVVIHTSVGMWIDCDTLNHMAMISGQTFPISWAWLLETWLAFWGGWGAVTHKDSISTTWCCPSSTLHVHPSIQQCHYSFFLVGNRPDL